MATYTIVSSTKTPLGPNEINAGTTITVNPGDVFIFGADADADVNFIASGAGPHPFDIVFNDAVGTLKVTIGSGLTPTVSIADNVDLSDVEIDAIASEGLTLTAGNNSSLNKLNGSGTGNDNITLGNDFTATGDWSTTGGDDTITAGDNVTLVNVKTGSNSDTIIFGDGATFTQIDTESGGDYIFMDDNAVGDKLISGSGDDFVRTGTNEQITTIDGGSGGNDVYETQDPTSASTGFETTNVICFVEGTLIRTADGPRPVETLVPGDLLWTRDHGLQPLRWRRGFPVSAEAQADARLRPVRIAPGALGPGVPSRALRVSQQHRLLLRSPIVQRIFGAPEILVAARKLVGFPGIDIAAPGRLFHYHHLLMDRHEIVQAEDAETETVLLGPQALSTLSALGVRVGLPESRVTSPETASIPARPLIVARDDIDRLIARSRKNRKALQDPVAIDTALLPETRNASETRSRASICR
ncbi:Hint domain-containing protein [Primorskyibacter sp. 2E233]|uniref:Hint domain-containing protein n=1 Tax=Primorskyibacter sp. 2E233 TaxID=3413431 RepID=UPI003BF455EB